MTPDDQPDLDALPGLIRSWAAALGFQQTGISDTDLGAAEERLERWLAAGYAGEMAYMARHGRRRSRPAELVPDTIRVISTRMDYLPRESRPPQAVLDDPNKAYVARYTLGRDYHKLMRRRLQRLADRIEQSIGPFGYRVFVDSAPVLEKPLAQKAGLGWIGKHTNVINKNAGSWFLLGEILYRPAAANGRGGERSLRHLPNLPRRLPYRCHRRALRAGCTALHLVSDHRAARRDTDRVAPACRQPDIRLRRLPAVLPLE